MALIPISMKINKFTKAELEKCCKKLEISKSRFIEIAIIEKLQKVEMENFKNENSGK